MTGNETYYYVYIMTTEYNTVLYTGMTNDLIRRVYEHRNGLVKGFTSRYNVHKLVYCEIVSDVLSAIGREKQIKGWKREKKGEIINGFNPGWRDLYDGLVSSTQILTSFACGELLRMTIQ